MANEKLDGTLLGVSAASLHVVGAGQAVEYMELVITNIHAADTVGYTVWFKPTGVAIGNEHRVLNTAGAHNLGPGDTDVWPMWPHLAEGDDIQAAASEANKIRISGGIREVTTGDPYKKISAQYLTASLATLYTVPSGFQMTRLWVVMCNHNTTNEEVEIQAIPSGQTAGDRYKLISQQTSQALEPGQTAFLKLHPYLTVGDFIQAKATTLDKVAIQMGFYLESV